jgi:16S rRNA (uracil1498-N3)-methyltransferase
MKKFLLSAPPFSDGMIRLYEKDYHYLVRVRRLKPGSCFEAILPGGTQTQVRVLSTVDNILIGECLEYQKQAPEKQTPQIVLFQGLPKGTKMDLIVRQAAEGGVSVVAPFETEYSTVKRNQVSDEKLKRWTRIVREARQQSGSAVETTVRQPCSIDALLEYWESEKNKFRQPLGILLHQEPLAQGTFHGYLGNCPDLTVLAVGPEGGFSPGEVSKFLAAGFKPLLLGNTILKTETAALCGTAAIRIILLENESWNPR